MSDALLEKLRQDLSSGQPARKAIPWHPPLISEFAQDVPVLAFDQALSNTGWVYFARCGGQIEVHAKGTLRMSTELTSHLGTWDKFSRLCTALDTDSQIWRDRLFYRARYVVWEQPSVGPGVRPESSLLAGAAIFHRVHPCRRAVVQARHASSVLIGNPHHRKAEVREAVARYVPESASRQYNEHERDALLLGLCWLKDLADREISK